MTTLQIMLICIFGVAAMAVLVGFVIAKMDAEEVRRYRNKLKREHLARQLNSEADALLKRATADAHYINRVGGQFQHQQEQQ